MRGLVGDQRRRADAASQGVLQLADDLQPNCAANPSQSVDDPVGDGTPGRIARIAGVDKDVGVGANHSRSYNASRGPYGPSDCQRPSRPIARNASSAARRSSSVLPNGGNNSFS